MKTIPSIEEVVEETVGNCCDCVYGMNIDCSMKEAKRLYDELENSPLLKKQLTQTLTQRDQAIKEALLEKIEERRVFVNSLMSKDFETSVNQTKGYNQALDDIKDIINQVI